MNARLSAYLELEWLMLKLDDEASEAADSIRDLMDPLWYSLSESDRAYLDSRDFAKAVHGASITLHAGRALFCTPVSPRSVPLPTGPIKHWNEAA